MDEIDQEKIDECLLNLVTAAGCIRDEPNLSDYYSKIMGLAEEIATKTS